MYELYVYSRHTVCSQVEILTPIDKSYSCLPSTILVVPVKIKLSVSVMALATWRNKSRYPLDPNHQFNYIWMQVSLSIVEINFFFFLF